MSDEMPKGYYSNDEPPALTKIGGSSFAVYYGAIKNMSPEQLSKFKHMVDSGSDEQELNTYIDLCKSNNI